MKELINLIMQEMLNNRGDILKGKITLSISIGLVALILTMVIFTQFKTVEETDITAIETMRETELRDELSSWKTKYEDVQSKLEERAQRIEEYKQELNNNADAMQLLENEVKEAESYLGLTALKGEGIEVTLSDNEESSIDYWDILSLVNELISAGAEAISINDERVVSTTEIVPVNGTIIFVNSKKISGPYIVRAIGEKKYLESALTIKGGYLDEKRIAYNKTVDYIIGDEIYVPAFTGKIAFEYAEKNEKEEVE